MGGEGGCERAYRILGAVTKSRLALSFQPTTSLRRTSGGYPFWPWLHLRSTGHLARVRRREAGGPGLRDVSGRGGVRVVDAAEDDVIAGMQARDLLRVEDADLREAMSECPLCDLHGARPAVRLRDGREDERVSVLQRPCGQRRRLRGGRRRRRRGRDDRWNGRDDRVGSEDGSSRNGRARRQVRRDERALAVVAARDGDRDECPYGREQEHREEGPHRVAGIAIPERTGPCRRAKRAAALEAVFAPRFVRRSALRARGHGSARGSSACPHDGQNRAPGYSVAPHRLQRRLRSARRVRAARRRSTSRTRASSATSSDACSWTTSCRNWSCRYISSTSPPRSWIRCSR